MVLSSISEVTDAMLNGERYAIEVETEDEAEELVNYYKHVCGCKTSLSTRFVRHLLSGRPGCSYCFRIRANEYARTVSHSEKWWYKSHGFSVVRFRDLSFKESYEFEESDIPIEELM